MTRGDTNEGRKERSGAVDAPLPTQGGGSSTWKGVKGTVD